MGSSTCPHDKFEVNNEAIEIIKMKKKPVNHNLRWLWDGNESTQQVITDCLKCGNKLHLQRKYRLISIRENRIIASTENWIILDDYNCRNI